MSLLSELGNTYQKQVTTNLQQLRDGIQSDLRAILSSWGLAAPLGSFGDIVFEVSTRKVETFNNYRRATKARYATHEILGEIPILEYLGPDGEEISFTMRFAMQLGLDPAKEVEKVRQMCRTGETANFILGNNVIGDNLWVIEGVGENVDAIDNMGHIVVSEIEVTLKEYVQ